MSVPERWVDMGADALYDLNPFDYEVRIEDRHDGDAEHVQAHAVLTAVLADLKQQIEEELEIVGVHGDANGDCIVTVWRDEVLDLIDKGSLDE